MSDAWKAEGTGGIDLWVLGPNGFLRTFTVADPKALPRLTARYDVAGRAVRLRIEAIGSAPAEIGVGKDAYGINADRRLRVAGRVDERWPTGKSEDWYDLTVTGQGFEMRLAGRIESGRHGISDPLVRA